MLLKLESLMMTFADPVMYIGGLSWRRRQGKSLSLWLCHRLQVKGEERGRRTKEERTNLRPWSAGVDVVHRKFSVLEFKAIDGDGAFFGRFAFTVEDHVPCVGACE